MVLVILTNSKSLALDTTKLIVFSNFDSIFVFKVAIEMYTNVGS